MQFKLTILLYYMYLYDIDILYSPTYEADDRNLCTCATVNNECNVEHNFAYQRVLFK